MIYKTLSNTGQQVSAIGQGTGVHHFDEKRLIRALQVGLEKGMTLIDTAEVYGNGLAEEIVGKAVKGRRDKAVIATKVSPENLGYKSVLKACDGSLRRLGTSYIDLYQIHWPNPRIPLSETLEAMARLVNDGKIHSFGVSNFSKKELQDVQSISGIKAVSLQIEYNLFDRSAEKETLSYCEENKIAVLAYSPLNHAREFSESSKLNCLANLAKKYSKTASQVILNWLTSKSMVIPIPTATNPDHVKENASATDFSLSNADKAEINRVFKMEVIEIPIDQIRVLAEAQAEGKVYQSIEEAKRNKFGFTPSPLELAVEIRKGVFLKPVSVVKSKSGNQRQRYDLTEGRVRYWAWVIAFEGNKLIPAICL